MLYTFELIVSIVIFLVVVYFNRKNIDKNSLWVYLLTGIGHSILELVAQGTGTRKIENAYVFNNIPLIYPFTAFILGFFEGGLFCLAAYYFVKSVALKDKFSTKIFIALSVSLFIIIFLGAITMRISIDSGASDVSLTRRDIFSPYSLILMIILYSFSIGYFALNKSIPKKEKLTLLYFYLGVNIFTFIVIFPNHIMGIRYIEKSLDGTYITASLLEQILVMYGYNIGLDAAGYFMAYYVIIYRFHLIEFKREQK